MSRHWSGRHAVVVGAGRSGIASARLLLHLGATVTLTDAREPQEVGQLGSLEGRVRLALGGHPDGLWDTAETVVASPGIAPQAPPLLAAAAAGCEILSEVELAYPLLTAPAIAITGSNGKSTVTSMVGAILAQAGYATAVCGNIGVPLSAVVLDEREGRADFERYVIEMSSFQTEAIDGFRARWSGILNISPDHLDRHGDLGTYAAAKLRLLHNCSADDWVVYGADDELVAEAVQEYPTRRAAFGQAPPESGPAAWIDPDGTLVWRAEAGAETPVVGSDELRIVGRHNLLNAAAAIALSILAGATPEAARAALAGFDGLEHRMEPCGELEGVLFINDSKATNVGATAAALAGLEGGVWLILGGRDKGSDFNLLRPLMSKQVRRVLLIGEATGRIAASLHGAAELERCGDLATAVERSISAAEPGDVVLLAPACTSFDQYESFEQRGRHFKQLVSARAGQSVSPDEAVR